MKKGTDVAVIGMSGRFPGAADLDQFWRNLAGGVESIFRYTDDELIAAGVDPQELGHPEYVKAGSHLDDVDLFDAAFFGINPREAESMDPQQRLFLECAWQALEHGGYDPYTYGGAIGVYAGCAMSTYLYRLYRNPTFMSLVGHLQVLIGNDKDYLTTHVSYKLNLRGPSVSVQTTCSTSLVAIAMACKSLQQNECDMALAGGVCVRVPQKSGYHYEPGGIYSPDGHCRVYDAEGAGVVFGSGVGAVLLKPLHAALADRDTIHAVIRGCAINNDGSSKSSYTAPGLDGQSDVIARAHAIARTPPSTITYVEGHGTGTPLGDPIEIAALTNVFSQRTNRRGFCAVGSVKSNVGHLDHSAGVAGFIKTVLALKNRMLPPTLNCRQPNPQIDFPSTPFFVNTELREWATIAGAPRRAGVSAFGIGGTNVHIVVEEAPAREPVVEAHGAHLLVLSARSSPALEEASARLAEHLRAHPTLSPADVAYTTHVGRHAFAYRRAIVFRSGEEAADRLQPADGRQVATGVVGSRSTPVSFMFSGQGAQYVNMGREIYETEITFRQIVDDCAERLREPLGLDLRTVLYPPDGDERPDLLRQTRLTQPALFVIEYALAKLLMHWGVYPEAMIGHSVGEYVAACIGGCLTLDAALTLVAERGRLMQAQPPGTMLAVLASESDVARLLQGTNLDLAAVNAETQCVVAGDPADVDAFAEQLTSAGIMHSRLETSHAFHSRMMEPAAKAFREFVAAMTLNPPQIRWVSSVTGTWITEAEATSPDYWADQLRHPVRFAAGVALLLQDAAGALLEVGPGETLSRLTRRAAVSDRRVFASLPGAGGSPSAMEFLLQAVGRMWVSGVAIDWNGFHAHSQHGRVPLPTYPFQRQRFWVDTAEEAAETADASSSDKNPDIGEWFYVPSWKYAVPPSSSPQVAGTVWLMFVDSLGIGDDIASRVQSMGHDVVAVSAGSEFRRLGDDRYEIDPQSKEHYVEVLRDLRSRGRLPAHIVHYWTISGRAVVPCTDAFVSEWHDRGFYSVLSIAQALVALNVTTPVRVDVVSDKMHVVTGDEPLNPAVSTVLGVCMSVPQEYPNIRCRCIDVVVPDAQGLGALTDRIVAELMSDRLEPVVAYRGGQRWVQVFDHERFDEPAPHASLLREGGVYLITGGLGHIPLTLARELGGSLQARLALLGRSKFPSRAEWKRYLAAHPSDDIVCQRIRQLQELDDLGVDFMVLRADVTDEWDVQNAVDRVYGRFGAINGVIHGAGDVSAAGFFAIDQADRSRCERQFDAKVQGLLQLERVLRGEPLDFWLLLSSISSVLAGLGYVAYAGANAFMDAFATERSAATGVPWLSVDWDTWDFTAEAQFDPAKPVILPDEGAECLRRVASWAAPSRVVVSVSDLYSRIDQWINLAAPNRGASTAAGQLHERPTTATSYVAPRNEVENRIATIWQELLGVGPIGVHDDFFNELSGSSLLATHLITRVREEFRAELPLRTFFETPTIANLATMIVTPGKTSDGRLTSLSA